MVSVRHFNAAIKILPRIKKNTVRISSKEPESDRAIKTVNK